MKRQALVLLGLAAAIGVPAALANHVPNGVYEGTHSNGGTVRLVLAANGGIAFFGAAGLMLGGTCPPSLGSSSASPFPIPNHTVTLISGTDTLTATFPTPTTAQGTYKLSCSPVTLRWSANLTGTSGSTPPVSTTPSSTPKGSTLAPYFRNAQSVRLERRAGVAYIRANLLACEGKQPFRLAVRQRRSVAKKFVAESRFTLKLPAGTPVTLANTPRCAKFSVAWKLAPKFFGGGLLVITLKLVDAGGRASGTPGFLVKSPKQ